MEKTIIFFNYMLEKINLLDVLIGLLIGFAIGGFVATYLQLNDDQTKAVTHGVAHYDYVTGKFEWNSTPK